MNPYRHLGSAVRFRQERVSVAEDVAQDQHAEDDVRADGRERRRRVRGVPLTAMLLCIFPPFGIGVVVHEAFLKIGFSEPDALAAGLAVVLSFIAMLVVLLIALDQASHRDRE